MKMKKNWYGLISGSFSKDKQKFDIQDINLYAESVIKLKNGMGITYVGQVDATISGKQILQNEGYFQLKHRDLDIRKNSLEYFLQYQWNGAWGMQYRALGGLNLRKRLFEEKGYDLYLGVGGFVRVKGNASQAAGATGNGGLLIIHGDAASRCGISMKGIDIVVGGSVGHMSAFMAQRGNLVVCGNAAEALGDSIYEARLYIAGSVESLGADCIEKDMRAEHLESLASLLERAEIKADPKKFRRYGSARKLYNFNVDLAAEIFGLEILRRNVEDADHNTTRFYVMSRTARTFSPDAPDLMTTFVFRVRNVPAALYKALGGFATNGVNMTKLESYMVGGNFFATQFYADVEGHPDDTALVHALEELAFFSKELTVLGVYPAHAYRETFSEETD